MSSCSGNGICTTEEGEYRCACSPGWTGNDCSVAVETLCDDDKDNDGGQLFFFPLSFNFFMSSNSVSKFIGRRNRFEISNVDDL